MGWDLVGETARRFVREGGTIIRLRSTYTVVLGTQFVLWIDRLPSQPASSLPPACLQPASSLPASSLPPACLQPASSQTTRQLPGWPTHDYTLETITHT